LRLFELKDVKQRVVVIASASEARQNESQGRIPATLARPGDAQFVPPQKEGAGKAGRFVAPAASCAK